jgi:hypothetical protein
MLWWILGLVVLSIVIQCLSAGALANELTDLRREVRNLKSPQMPLPAQMVGRSVPSPQDLTDARNRIDITGVAQIGKPG